jgi:Bacterial membrane protein YfhO
MTGDADGDGLPRWLPWLLVPVAFLSDPAAAIPRLSYYFRDFTLTFCPLRLLSASEMAQGRWPGWNPYVNEGTFLLPSLYPLDLLHVLWPTPVGVSWLLTLHFPMAALGFYALARALGTGRLGAFSGASAYALGGLAVSSLNLYVFFQALALAPWLILTLVRAAERGGRALVGAAVVFALALSTLAVEFVAQAVLLGIAIGAFPPLRRSAPRVGAALLLGVGLGALPIALVVGLLPETARAGGFDAARAGSYSVHPLTLLQTVISGLFGSLRAPLERWWGGRFFSDGFPYFFSIYLGPAALGIAAAGLDPLRCRKRGWVLLALAGLGLWYSLGPWGGLAPALAPLPLVRWFRFPSKALFTPYLVTCLLVAFGADRLRRGGGWRLVRGAAVITALAAALVAAGALFGQELLGRWLALSPAVTNVFHHALPKDCGWTLLAASLAGVIASLASSRALRGEWASLLLTALAVADLARAGAGVNPQVSPAFFDLLPETRSLGLDRPDGGRTFSYGVRRSPQFRAFLEAHAPGTGLWAFFVNRQTLFPFNNVLDRIETAEGTDRTSFLPNAPVLGERDYDPDRVASILPILRNAGVSRIVSIDPLGSPDLRLLSAAPAGPPGLRLRVYALSATWPRAYVACRVRVVARRREALLAPFAAGFDPAVDVALERTGLATCHETSVRRLERRGGRVAAYEVESDGPGYLVTRDSFARGWRARIDGRPTPVVRADGKHRAVAIEAGTHEVTFTYEPPGMLVGLTITTGALLTALALSMRPGLRSPSLPSPTGSPADALE